MKIKNFKLKIEKGFTLIELLIVIALIGVLAVALLSTINPVEQTRKAQDSARKSAAAELLNAIERYQSTFGCYPWEYAPDDSCIDTSGDESPYPIEDEGSLEDVLVGEAAEMKAEFFSRDVVTDGDLSLGIEDPTDTNLVHICFAPESNAFTEQAEAPGDGESCGGNPDGCVCIPE